MLNIYKAKSVSYNDVGITARIEELAIRNEWRNVLLEQIAFLQVLGSGVHHSQAGSQGNALGVFQHRANRDVFPTATAVLHVCHSCHCGLVIGRQHKRS